MTTLLVARWLARLVCPSSPEPAQLYTLAEAACLGLLVNYSLYLLLHESRDMFWLLTLPAAFGLLQTAKLCLKVDFGKKYWKLWMILIVFLPFVVATLYEPLSLLDARFIWYHHARALWMFDYSELPAYLRDVDFTRSNYPKLLPVLGAEVASIFGFWNDVLPKIASASLLVFFLLGACCFGINYWLASGLIFAMAPVFNLTGGYADGPLAIYAMLSCAALAAFANEKSSIQRPRWMALALLGCGVAMNLKNEGLLFALCLIACYLILQKSLETEATVSSEEATPATWFKQITASCWNYIKPNWPWLLAGLIPFLLWQGIYRYWGLENDLTLNHETLHRMGHRLLQVESWRLYFQYLFFYAGNKVGIVMLIASIVVYIERRICGRLSWQSALPYSVALLYFIAMSLVYFGTYHQMEWHLKTSILRTMLLPMALAIYASVESAWRLIASADNPAER